MLTNRQEVAFFATLGAILFTFLVIIYIYGHKHPKIESLAFDTGRPAPITDLAVSARAAYVYDINTGTVLYAKNEHERLPLASVVKVMSALVASELAPEGSTVTISREAVRQNGDSGLLPGERWRLKDLLDFSLVSSANDGVRAVALALGALHASDASGEYIVNDFVQKMNAKANDLGMKNTYYFNDTGLDESEEKGGAYGSAKDQALLFEYILRHKPTLLAATREPSIRASSLDSVVHTVQNTDTIVGKIPGLMASKTGFTDLAGGNLVVAFDPEIGRPIIISVLGGTAESRFEDMERLVRASLESVQDSQPVDSK